MRLLVIASLLLLAPSAGAPGRASASDAIATEDTLATPFDSLGLDSTVTMTLAEAGPSTRPVTVTATDGVMAEFSRVEPWPSGASESLATESIRITTDDDSVHAFVSAEPWPQGFIKAVRADGGVEFLPVHRIRKIQQVGSVDITDRMLVERRATLSGDQESSPVRKNKELTFRGYPYPETKWFFLLQTGILAGIGRDPNAAHLVFDFGVMRNIGSHWAAGVNLHVQAGDVSGVGVVLRGRRWLSRSISVDLGAGFLNPGDVPYMSTVWIGQAHLNLGNVASMTLEMDRWKHDYSRFPDYYVPLGYDVESGTRWKAGGTIGYLPGVVALALTYGTLILLYIAASSSGY